MLWWKYQAFQKGISTREFNKCTMKDLKEVFMLEDGIKDKAQREANIQKLMGEIR